MTENHDLINDNLCVLRSRIAAAAARREETLEASI